MSVCGEEMWPYVRFVFIVAGSDMELKVSPHSTHCFGNAMIFSSFIQDGGPQKCVDIWK